MKFAGLSLKKGIYAPRWIVLIIDMAFSVFALSLAILLVYRYNAGALKLLLVYGAFILGLRFVSFLLEQTFSGVVRYTGIKDVWRIFKTLTKVEILLLLLNWAIYMVWPDYAVSFVFLWLEYSALLCLMIFSRLIFKLLFAENFRQPKNVCNTIVYGQSEYLILVQHLLRNTLNSAYSVTAFVDTNRRTAGKTLLGIKVYSPDSLSELLESGKYECLIIAQKLIQQEDRKNLIEVCMQYSIQIKEILEPENLLNGTFNMGQLKNINIEDLLQRDVIELDKGCLISQIKGKTVMVTGAAGSIGSEIVRQLTRFNPEKIVLVDIAESPLYDLELELIEQFKFLNFEVEMSNIRDYATMERIFQKFHPEIIYHAAAYKHVPMIEKKPLEGLRTNVFGTRNLANLAVQYGVKRFVMVSTDKAVNPTNVMGCTKRIAEIFTQSMNRVGDTAFITTRFGNVLGSNGSVVPRFVKQIEEGGPVTVTHPDITRFFMTIPEACQLVLQAGALGEGGEIFVFDMGESVKISDLAQKMIRMAGLQEGVDIDIVYTGLRPGEKLYEEVLSDKESVLPTIHQRIHRAKVREYDIEEVRSRVDCLFELVYNELDEELSIKWMKLLVPEFKSQNSEYEKYDLLLEQEEFRERLEEKVLMLLNRIETKQSASAMVL